jgi:hypothetical protein
MKHHDPEYSSLEPINDYRFLKIGEIIKSGDKHYLYGAWGDVSGAIGVAVKEHLHAPICRKIEYVKHHNPKYADLAPLEGHRFLKLGEEIKAGDSYYSFGQGPWTKFDEGNSNVGAKLADWQAPMCTPIIPQPTILELEFEVVPSPEVSIGSGLVAFKVKKCSGFKMFGRYVASNGYEFRIDIRTELSEKHPNVMYVNKKIGDTLVVSTKEEFSRIEAAAKEITAPKIIKRITFINITGVRYLMDVSEECSDLFCGIDVDTQKPLNVFRALIKNVQEIA